MIDKAVQLLGEFSSSFGKTWAASGGALIPHGGTLAANAAGIGAIAGAVASHKFGSFTKAIGKYG